MYGWLLTNLIAWSGAIASLRYPLIGLNVYIGLAILRPQSIFSFAGDLSGLSRIVGYAVLAGWAMQGFGSWKFGRARVLVSLYITFIAWFVISAALALEQGPAFASVDALAKFALPFFVGLTLMRTEKDWLPTLWTIVLCQGYVGFEMNLNYLFKNFNTASEGFGGMDNNCFGVSLVVVLGPAIALMLSSKSWLGRALAGISAALILHTILLTFSRGAMVGLLVVGAITLIMIPKKPSNIVAVVIVLLLAVRFTGPQLFARYSTTFAGQEERDGSAQSRVDLWRDCMRVVGDYPIFGVGPANWRIISYRYGWTPGKSAHSVWMETAAEVGAPAAVVLLMFFSVAAIRLWPIARARLTATNRNEIILASGVILSAVGFIVSGQFVSVPGLEAPYYVVMLGAVMLKLTRPAALPSATTSPFDRPAHPQRWSPQTV